MSDISSKNSTKNLDRCIIRTHTCLIRSRDLIQNILIHLHCKFINKIYCHPNTNSFFFFLEIEYLICQDIVNFNDNHIHLRLFQLKYLFDITRMVKTSVPWHLPSGI
jgi:hypothetical protein